MVKRIFKCYKNFVDSTKYISVFLYIPSMVHLTQMLIRFPFRFKFLLVRYACLA